MTVPDYLKSDLFETTIDTVKEVAKLQTLDVTTTMSLTGTNFPSSFTGTIGSTTATTIAPQFSTHPTWTTNPMSITATSTGTNQLQVNGDAVITGNLKIGGVSITETMEIIAERLSILVVDPDKVDKYQALKAAYDDFKMLEALLKDKD